MTAQISEKLIYQGERVSLLTNPLDSYFALSGRKASFQLTSTALWRGYVGTWELLNDRLYMVELKGTLADGSRANLESIFPGFPDRVFAHWYSGTLRIPRGKMLEYRHMGYGSQFERDEFIKIRQGVVTSITEKVNGVAAEEAKEGYGVNAMFVWPAEKKQKDAET